MLSIGIPSIRLPTLVGMATTIGERIRIAREALGYTDQKRKRTAFAKLIGISAPSLHDLESGESDAPSAQTLMRMEAKGINPRFIMYGTQPVLTRAVLTNGTVQSSMHAGNLNSGDKASTNNKGTLDMELEQAIALVIAWRALPGGRRSAEVRRMQMEAVAYGEATPAALPTAPQQKNVAHPKRRRQSTAERQ